MFVSSQRLSRALDLRRNKHLTDLDLRHGYFWLLLCKCMYEAVAMLCAKPNVYLSAVL